MTQKEKAYKRSYQKEGTQWTNQNEKRRLLAGLG